MSATASYPDFVRRLFNTTKGDDTSKDFTHAILGIATEVRELMTARDRVNAIEELGDLAFYEQALQQVVSDYLGDDFFFADEAEAEAHSMLARVLRVKLPFFELDNSVNDLLDAAKRWVGYGKEPASLPAIVADAMVVVRMARALAPVSTLGVTKDTIVAANMAKLLKRYPGGDFDQFRALQRDLEGERAILETAVLG